MITTITLNTSIDKAYFMENKIENGTVMRVGRVHNTAGGKGLNVARIVRLCGSEVLAGGFVGGFNGSYLTALLKEDGVPENFYHCSGETRSCINILDPGYGSTEYLEPGFEIRPEEWKEFKEKSFPACISKSDVVAMSGSLPKGIGKDAYAELIRLAKGAGKTVILDTSGESLKKGIEACPDLVKPNKDEIEALFDIKITSGEETISYAKKIHEAGVAYVVISLGGDGSVLVCDNGIYRARTPKLKVVNTVGCGDSMIGGFAVAFERHMDPAEALKYASSVASANAMSPNTGDFEQPVFEDILGKTQVEKIG